MLRSALFFALLLIPACALAQPHQGQARLDSLLAEVPKMGEDTNAVKLFAAVGNDYGNINPAEAGKWNDRGMQLTQKLGWRKGEGLVYTSIAIAHYRQGSYAAALEAAFKALKIGEDEGDKSLQKRALNEIGLVYLRKQEFNKAIEYGQRSMKLSEELGDKRSVMVQLLNIGGAQMEAGQYREAIETQMKALKIAEELRDRWSIGALHLNIAETYGKMKQYDTALFWGFRASRMSELTENPQLAGMNYGDMGIMYHDIVKDGKPYHPNSLLPANRAALLDSSVIQLRRGIALIRESGTKEELERYYQNLADALTMQGAYKDALQAYRDYIGVKDSMFSIANNEKITNLETARAVELKDKDIQIAKLKKRNERILFAGGFAVLLLLMGILFRNFRKQQHSNHLLSKEKKRSDDLLLNILPAEVAEELKDSGASAAKQYDEVSVLFTDFVDFTGTAESLSPQALVKELNECFTAFDAIIERNGLEKIKTIGDAYMAVCGLPASDPLHARKTVQAAIEIKAFIEARKKQERAFEIRIGIHSGPVVAGIVGVKKFAYDIWGDTVNTAARMEQHSEPGAINISQSTYELVKDEFACDYRGKIAAKNKGEVEMYFVEMPVAEVV